MRLQIICEAIYSELNTSGLADYSLNDLYQELIFKGGNEQLNESFPMCHYPSKSHIVPRTIPLTGDEDIEGKYSLFSYIGHLPEIVLITFNSLTDLEQAIIGNGGILNGFTTIQIAFVNGSVKPYRIECVNTKTSKTEILNVDEIITLKDSFGFGELPLNIKRIVWSDI